MAYVIKLDTDIATIVVTTPSSYVFSQATLELNDVIAYFTHVNQFTGAITTYTSLIFKGSSIPIIVDETYATIDLLLNP